MRRIYIIIYAAGFIFFGWLCYSVNQSQNLPGDIAISTWFAEIELPFVNALMQFISTFGDTIPAMLMVALIAGVAWFFRRRLEAVFIAVLPALAALLTWLLKVLIDRPRPGSELLDNGGLSFPSGHVTYAVILFSLLFYLLPKLMDSSGLMVALRILMVLIIVLIAVSRVYLGAHWPSDVLGSFVLGVLLLAPAIVLYKHYAKRSNDAGAA